MKNSIVLAGFLVFLCACGGGGGKTPETAVPAPAQAPFAVFEDDLPSLMAPVGNDPVISTEAATPSLVPVPLESHYAVAGYLAEGAATAEADADAGPLSHTESRRARLYVSPSGSDQNPGTYDKPFRSIAKAARAVVPGTIVYVAPGTYTGGFRTSVNGTEKARISFVSTRKWGARIVPARISPNKTAWDNRGNYVDIVGFEVDGSGHVDGTLWTYGIYNGGSYDSIRNNHVHHIARNLKCNNGGGAAIGIDSYYGGVQSEILSNLVHDIGPAGCRFVQGIYVSTSGKVKNNVVYRVSEGGIHLWHDARDVIITNNTVTLSHTGIIVGGGNYYKTRGPNDHTAVYSNIVYDNVMGISEQGATGKNNTYRNNLVFQNSRYNWQLKNGLRHESTVASPPEFLASARTARPNLKLSGTSPAIGRATPTHAASTDFEGKPRNSAAGYDIGAYQH